jgi:SHAQKYF class myb-like DNA-binding protein
MSFPTASPSYDSDDPPSHTQFLDLTNGKGGDLLPHPYLPPQPESDYAHATETPVDAQDSDDQDDSNMGDDEDDGGMEGSPTIRGTVPPGSGAIGINPNTPGKVVDVGQEHTGRWTKAEHEAFLSALQTYGKEWKKVAAKVKTRTVVQTRTHAQKYFQKLQKAIESTGKDDVTQVHMGIDSGVLDKQGSGSAAGSSHQKKQRRPAPVSLQKPERRSSSATISAAQVISNLSSHTSTQPSSMGPSVAARGSAPLKSKSADPQYSAMRPHGFSTEVSSSSFPSSFSSWMGNNSMKITAPNPEDTKNSFPEPSPAATGKRKLAEIAAARMLAGVGQQQQRQLQPLVDRNDEAPTPPLPDTENSKGSSLNLHEAPPPPLLFGDGFNMSSLTSKKGVALQIVNPESLGVSHDKPRRGGGDSPVTPWDGQLEALVYEKAKVESKEEETGGSKPAALHPVCGPSTAYGRTPLHQAVCEMDLDGVRCQLQDMPSQNVSVLHGLDEAGYSPLHSACALRLSYGQSAIVAPQLVRLLLSAGSCDPSRPDIKGNTPLHWAARSGDRDVVEILLLKNSLVDARNQAGEAPLHWAMRAGERGTTVALLLLENGARPSSLSKEYRRPLDVAADGFLDEERSLAVLRVAEQSYRGIKPSKALKKRLKETASERRDARAALLIRSAQSRTLVLHHPECLEHHPKSATDWEAPDRIRSIMRRVLPASDPTGATETSGIFPHEVTVSKEFERAKLDLLSRVHSTDYLSFVNALSKDLEKQLRESGGSFSAMDESDNGFGSPPPVVPFTPLVQRSLIKVDESRIKLGVNSDTSFSAGSLRAARRAAGAVQHAVDCVLVGRNRNAFCVVRPPGHHAGINGLLDGGESCGFCIFNNVAAGALYAISEDRLLCGRCAIVDIDVHHGNGTEDIVRKCHDPSKLLFFSIHLYDNDRKKRGSNQFSYKFYPGTGSEDDLALNIINVPIVPLWKEHSATVQPSIKTHNTRRKTRTSQEGPDEESDTTPKDSSRTSDVGSEEGSTAASNSSPRPGGLSSGRTAYRNAIQNRLLPALRAFNPDLILISAGFDAAKGDVGNARHERGGEKVGLDLEPEDYAWTTRKILEIADICCQGRVVSVLEGGYGRTPAALPTGSSALDRTLFAECAIRHLHAMVDPYDTEQRFS